MRDICIGDANELLVMPMSTSYLMIEVYMLVEVSDSRADILRAQAVAQCVQHRAEKQYST